MYIHNFFFIYRNFSITGLNYYYIEHNSRIDNRTCILYISSLYLKLPITKQVISVLSWLLTHLLTQFNHTSCRLVQRVKDKDTGCRWNNIGCICYIGALALAQKRKKPYVVKCDSDGMVGVKQENARHIWENTAKGKRIR